jgi:hypothetical protein
MQRKHTGGSCSLLVMRGQKRVEDARERAYDPRIHLLRKKVFTKRMDPRVKPAGDRTFMRHEAASTRTNIL